jgi:preprotein translocase subunit SecE
MSEASGHAKKESTIKSLQKFIPEVNEERKKVTWPSRRETIMTTAFVFVFAIIAAIYFMIVDTIIHKVINFITDFFSR